MKVHNNKNFLKTLGPTADEMQAALKAGQKRKEIKLDSEATEKIKKFQDQVIGAQQKHREGSKSRSKWTQPIPGLNEEKHEERSEDPKEGTPSPKPVTRIDFKA
jgi:hypothetical protein